MSKFKIICYYFSMAKMFSKNAPFTDIAYLAFFLQRPRWPVILSFAMPHTYFH